MARYIDADVLISHLQDEIKECEPPFGSRANGKSIAYGTILGLKSAISFATTLPSPDVVPKSEYDNLKSQFEALDHECDRLERAESNRHDAIEQAKTEVAREIFAEIDDMIKYFTVPNDCALVNLKTLEELKKKYIEGETS